MARIIRRIRGLCGFAFLATAVCAFCYYAWKPLSRADLSQLQFFSATDSATETQETNQAGLNDGSFTSSTVSTIFHAPFPPDSTPQIGKVPGDVPPRSGKGKSTDTNNLQTLNIATSSLDISVLEAPASRTILAIGVPQLLPYVFLPPRFSVFYIEEVETVLQTAFDRGCPGLLLDGSAKLPFVDFAFDLVIVGNRWCPIDCQEEQRIDDILRVLRPSGKLVVWPNSDVAVWRQHPLTFQGGFANVMIRVGKHVSELPVCPQCLPLCRDCSGEDAPYIEPAERCQAYIMPEYVAVDWPARLPSMGKGGTLSETRISKMRLENTERVNFANQTSWLTHYRKCCGHFLEHNYLGKEETGRWLPPQKNEWLPEYSEWIRSGKVKRLLDAGAGTCTLDAIFRLTGLADKLKIYVAFGYYDCSMARICAERGTVIFEHDWLKPLSVCAGCRFDMIFQAEGMHHSEDTNAVLDNFDAVLACGGRMVLQDQRWKVAPGSLPWDTKAYNWATAKHYDVPVAPEQRGGQWRIVIVKKCEATIELPSATLDIASPSLDASLLKAPASRTILAIGVPQLLPDVFQPPRYSVFYVEESQSVLPSAFERGCPGLVLSSSTRLPFVDFAFDVVAVGHQWCPGGCSEKRRADDILRVLRPAGKLVVWPDSDVGIWLQHPLIRPGHVANVLVRVDSHTKELPICPQCLPLCRDCSGEDAPYIEPAERCQAYIMPEYIAVDSPSRLPSMGKGGALSETRISKMRLENTERVNFANQTSWLTHYRKCCGHFLISNYLGQAEGGKWLPPRKNEWLPEYTEWIRSGKVKRLLDAGAGTCTLDAIFRLTGVADRLKMYAAFGFYDCSMARICAERGTVIFEHDWLNPLPMCVGCHFDMIFQAEGMHHTSEETALVLDNFDAVLACGGRMVLQDQRWVVPDGKLPWDTKALHWAKAKKYEVLVGPENQKGKQWRIIIVKRCANAEVGKKPKREDDEPKRETSQIFDVASAKVDLKLLDAPVSRTVLAVALPKLLPTSFRSPHYSVFYLEEQELLLQPAFDRGSPGLLINSSASRRLPFVDFTFDIVVVGMSWCPPPCTEDWRIDELLRLLRPSGKLVLWPGSEIAEMRTHPLVQPGTLSNVFVRAATHVAGLPVCRECVPVCKVKCWAEDEPDSPRTERCQAYISKDYRSVDTASRRTKLLASTSLSEARISNMRLQNAQAVHLAGHKTWLEEYSKCCEKTLVSNYLGSAQKGGGWLPPRKVEWLPEYTDWIRSGKVKRLLDAGAGACTLDAVFRLTDVSKHLHVYAAFGFYDCSMARVCAERGSLIFDHNWMYPIPTCSGCLFDMIFQAEGMHHSPETSVVLDNFDAVLACDGRMVLQDLRGDDVAGRSWDVKAQRWAQRKRYGIPVGPEQLKGKQWRIIIIKRCRH